MVSSALVNESLSCTTSCKFDLLRQMDTSIERRSMLDDDATGAAPPSLSILTVTEAIRVPGTEDEKSAMQGTANRLQASEGHRGKSTALRTSRRPHSRT